MDELVKERFLPVSIDRAWRILTDPRELEQWFGDRVELDLRPGGRIVIGWHETGSYSGIVESVDPPRRLVYRWCIAWNEPVDVGPTTRVELSLRPAAAGVILRVRESGFEGLPPRLLDDNRTGWDLELEHLVNHIEQVDDRHAPA